MLIVDDNKRFSALQVLNHSWIKVSNATFATFYLFNNFLSCTGNWDFLRISTVPTKFQVKSVQ